LIDGHSTSALSRRASEAAASSDAALIDGHARSVDHGSFVPIAASSDAALIDGHRMDRMWITY